jgi:hypothetical protein
MTSNAFVQTLADPKGVETSFFGEDVGDVESKKVDVQALKYHQGSGDLCLSATEQAKQAGWEKEGRKGTRDERRQ